MKGRKEKEKDRRKVNSLKNQDPNSSMVGTNVQLIAQKYKRTSVQEDWTNKHCNTCGKGNQANCI